MKYSNQEPLSDRLTFCVPGAIIKIKNASGFGRCIMQTCEYCIVFLGTLEQETGLFVIKSGTIKIKGCPG